MAYDKTPEGERFSGLILGVCGGKKHIQYHSNCEDQLQCWLVMVKINLFGSVTDRCCSLTPFTGLKERDGTCVSSAVYLYLMEMEDRLDFSCLEPFYPDEV